MGIKQQAMEDLKVAMKARDAAKVGALRLIRAEILKLEKGGKVQDAEDGDIIPLLQRMMKQRREAIESFTAGGREDLAEKERAEMSVIEGYLPDFVSAEEIRAAVKEIIEETRASGMSNLGRVMGPTMKRLKETGKPVDGATVRTVVAEMLEGAEAEGE